MIGSQEEFKQYLETVRKSVKGEQSMLVESIMLDLQTASDWGVHDLPEVTPVTERLNDYLQSGGLFGHTRNYELLEVTKTSSKALRKRLIAHHQEYMDALAEQLDLLDRTRKAMLLSSTSVSDVLELFQLEETYNRVKEDYLLRSRSTDERHDCSKASLLQLEATNALMRKVLNAGGKKVRPAVITISHVRNIIMAEYPEFTLYIDVGGKKFHDNTAVIIAGRCYQELAGRFHESKDEQVPSNAVRQLSVCFKHVADGRGSMVMVNPADTKTIKSFEDTLYNRKAD